MKQPASRYLDDLNCYIMLQKGKVDLQFDLENTRDAPEIGRLKKMTQ